MFGIGGFELFIIVVFIFIIFGPDKLPEIIKLSGLAIKKFKKAKAEMDKVLKEEIVDPVMEVVNEEDKQPLQTNLGNTSNLSDIKYTSKDNTNKENNSKNLSLSSNTNSKDDKKVFKGDA